MRLKAETSQKISLPSKKHECKTVESLMILKSAHHSLLVVEQIGGRGMDPYTCYDSENCVYGCEVFA